jgi:hypothetical protein
MLGFVYIAISAAVVGGIVGWFPTRRLGSLVLRAIAAAFTLLLALLALNGSPESWNLRYILTAIPYVVVAFTIFVLAPTVAGALLVRLAVARFCIR